MKINKIESFALLFVFLSITFFEFSYSQDENEEIVIRLNSSYETLEDSIEDVLEKRAWRQCLSSIQQNLEIEASSCLFARSNPASLDEKRFVCVPLHVLFSGVEIGINYLEITATECESLPRSTKSNCKKLAPLKNRIDFVFDKEKQRICVDTDVNTICKGKSDSCSRFYDIEVPHSKCASHKSTVSSILVAKHRKSIANLSEKCTIAYVPLTTGIITTGITYSEVSAVHLGKANVFKGRLNGIQGYRFVPTVDIQVTKLGAFCQYSSISYSPTVGIWKSSNKQLLVSEVISVTPCRMGLPFSDKSYIYHGITPIILKAGEEYRIVAEVPGSEGMFTLNRELSVFTETILDIRSFTGIEGGEGFLYPENPTFDLRFDEIHVNANFKFLKIN